MFLYLIWNGVQIDEIISFIIRSPVIMLQKEASAPIRSEDFGLQAVQPFRKHSSSIISNISHLAVPTRRIVSALWLEELLPKAVLLSRKETELTIIDNKVVDSLPFSLSRKSIIMIKRFTLEYKIKNSYLHIITLIYAKNNNIFTLLSFYDNFYF